MGTISVSLPSDGTTADVADHNTPITTIVNEINGNLDNDNIKSAAAIAGSKLASASVTATQIDFGGSGSGIWWQEIGRTTLGSAADVITVSSFTAKKYLKILITTIATGTTSLGVTFNSDTAGNYSRQSIINGAAPADATSQTALGIDGGASAENKLSVLEIINISAQEKIGTVCTTESGGAGAANAPDVSYQNVKWANTSAQITTVTVTNGGTGDYATGSEIIILGHD